MLGPVIGRDAPEVIEFTAARFRIAYDFPLEQVSGSNFLEFLAGGAVMVKSFMIFMLQVYQLST